ncbi:hypothetical protein GQ457_02G021140 [Hibiscus cannabinus]
MSDWGPVFVAVMLFLLLTPGLLIQIPGRLKYVEFGNFQTSGVSILVHSIIYFALMCIFLIAIGVHINLLIKSSFILSTLSHINPRRNIVQEERKRKRDGGCQETKGQWNLLTFRPVPSPFLFTPSYSLGYSPSL